jgi:SurA-like protein
VRRYFVAASLAAIAACSGMPAAAQTTDPSPSSGSVVAQVGDRKITLQELEEKWQEFDPAGRARFTEMHYQNRRSVLDRLLAELLIEDAAKSAGLSTAAYLEQAMKKRVKPVTEADLQKMWELNKDRAQGQTFEQLRGAMREFLEDERQQTARAQLVDELRKMRGGAVRVLLDPPRHTIELAQHDPATGPASAPVTIVEFSDYQ